GTRQGAGSFRTPSKDHGGSPKNERTHVRALEEANRGGPFDPCSVPPPHPFWSSAGRRVASGRACRCPCRAGAGRGGEGGGKRSSIVRAAAHPPRCGVALNRNRRACP